MSWHVPTSLARDYAAGELRGARAASVEAHVLACGPCRSLVGGHVPTDRLEAVWAEVENQVDAPRVTRIERLLTRLGMADTDARLVAATPSLRSSWFLALAAVLAFAVWAGQNGERGEVVFLIVAPLVPVLAVAGAYGPRIDPTFEISVSSPYPTLRLILLRAATVVLASGLLAGLASIWLPDVGVAVAWLLPALALVSVTLVLARWMPLPAAAGWVGAFYALPLLGALYADAPDVLLSPLLQWTALAVGAVAMAVLTADPQLRAALRRNR